MQTPLHGSTHVSLRAGWQAGLQWLSLSEGTALRLLVCMLEVSQLLPGCLYLLWSCAVLPELGPWTVVQENSGFRVAQTIWGFPSFLPSPSVKAELESCGC